MTRRPPTPTRPGAPRRAVASPAGGSSEPPARGRWRSVRPGSAASPTVARPRGPSRPTAASTQDRYPFDGPPPGRHRHPDPGPAALRLLRRHHRLPRGAGRAPAPTWTAAARQMTAGSRSAEASPRRTTRRRPTPARRSASVASGLTLTFGFGPSLFEKDGRTASASRDRRPAALRELPHFPADNLDPRRSDGDLCVQACAARPAGRGARDPQPRPDRLRHRRDALGPARLRPHLVDLDPAGHAAQPDRLQGRHRQPQGRERRGHRRSSSGSRRTTTPAPTGWPAAPTSSPAGSTCASSRGTAPACASRRR